MRRWVRRCAHRSEGPNAVSVTMPATASDPLTDAAFRPG